MLPQSAHRGAGVAVAALADDGALRDEEAAFGGALRVVLGGVWLRSRGPGRAGCQVGFQKRKRGDGLCMMMGCTAQARRPT